MGLTETIDDVVNKLETETEKLAGKAKAKLDEKLTDEKKAEYKQKFENAKAKIDEQFTDEKKAGYKQNIDNFMDNADEELTRFGTNMGKDLKDMFGSDKKEQ